MQPPFLRRTMILRSILMSLACAAVGCDLPRDPEATLARVQNGTIRVGLTEHEPWARFDGEEPAGVEVELVRRLAKELGAEIKWIPGNESELMQAAEAFELDLVIGGITDETPWKKRVGLTRPYLETETRIALPAGHAPITGLDGIEVAVPPGDAIIEQVRSEGGQPVPTENRAETDLAVAARDFESEAWGLTPTEIELETEKHVMAVPPGENAWLLHVEKFLARQEPEIRAMLVEELRR
jgi:polar amino acid transport system substrate-binding protein